MAPALHSRSRRGAGARGPRGSCARRVARLRSAGGRLRARVRLAAVARCAGIARRRRTSGRSAFERALELHDLVPTPFERARTELCYAERLRRARRRVEARGRLQAALEVFDSLGAAPWSERARAELRASGQTARRRATPVDALTAQELAVARSSSRARRIVKPQRRSSSVRRPSSSTSATSIASSACGLAPSSSAPSASGSARPET